LTVKLEIESSTSHFLSNQVLEMINLEFWCLGRRTSRGLWTRPFDAGLIFLLSPPFLFWDRLLIIIFYLFIILPPLTPALRNVFTSLFRKSMPGQKCSNFTLDPRPTHSGSRISKNWVKSQKGKSLSFISRLLFASYINATRADTLGQMLQLWFVMH